MTNEQSIQIAVLTSWVAEGFTLEQSLHLQSLGFNCPQDARERISYLYPERRDQLGLTALGL